MAVYIRAAETSQASQASQAMAWPVSAAQFLKVVTMNWKVL